MGIAIGILILVGMFGYLAYLLLKSEKKHYDERPLTHTKPAVKKPTHKHR